MFAALEDWGASVDDPENSAERVFASNSELIKVFIKTLKLIACFKPSRLPKLWTNKKPSIIKPKH